jgi:hypothetical protein
MEQIISRGFRICYPGIAKTLKSIIKIGPPCSKNHPIVPINENFIATWDTGATISCIKEEIAVSHNLPICGQRECRGVNSIKTVNTYLSSLVLPNNFAINEIELASCDNSLAVDMLIGMDIISKGELLINTCNNMTIYSFQMPAPTAFSLDQIQSRPQALIQCNENFNENMLCPCGSLSFFKTCCAK